MIASDDNAYLDSHESPTPKRAKWLVLAIVFTVTIVAVAVWYYVRADSLDAKIAGDIHCYYLFEVADQEERADYQRLINFSRTEYPLPQSEEVLVLGNTFLDKYPNSLFSLKKGELKNPKQWADVFGLPEEKGVQIQKLAKGWLGEIRTLRDTMFVPRYILHVRSEYGAKENQTPGEPPPLDIDAIVEAQSANLLAFADQEIARLEREANEMVRQMHRNKIAFESEKVEVRTSLINATTQCTGGGFDTAKLYLRRKLALPEWDRTYNNQVADSANSRLAQPLSETIRVRARLSELRHLAHGLGKGDLLTYSKLKSKFEDRVRDREKVAKAMIANLPAEEADLKKARDEWLKSYTAALGKAEAYFNLVAGTRDKFGLGWEVQRKRHPGLLVNPVDMSNITSGKARKDPRFIDVLWEGWQPNHRGRKIEDLQVRVKSVNSEAFAVEFRAVDSRGLIVPKGTDRIPLWHAVHLGLFHYFAKQVKSEHFDENHLCFEFFVRPAWFRKLTQNGTGEKSVVFLKGELEKAIEVWKPNWDKKLISVTLEGLKRLPKTRWPYLAKKLRDVLEPSKEFQRFKSEQEWYSKLLESE